MKVELYEGGVIWTVTHGVEIQGLRVRKQHKLDVVELKCLQSMCEVLSFCERKLEGNS